MNKIKEVFVSKTFILDVLRGFAAIYVLIGHARWLLWEGYSEGYLHHPETYGILATAFVCFLLIFKFGHQAVLLFFVLSGFVIHYSSYKNWLRTNEFSVGQYVYKRFRRIYPPFIFSMVLTFILDSFGKHLGYSIYDSANFFYVESDLSKEALFGNVCMLQTVYTNVWGSNNPVWSLMYEWWFYLLYIPVFYCNRRQPFITTLVICLICALNFTIDIGLPELAVKILNYFLAWYMGLVLADVYLKRYSVKVLCGTIGIVCITIMYLLAVHLQNITKDLALGFVMAMFIYASLLYSYKIIFLKSLHFLGDFSYTLYVIHYPILTFFAGTVLVLQTNQRPSHFGYMFSGIILCMVLAWLIHLLVEKPFIKKTNTNAAH